MVMKERMASPEPAVANFWLSPAGFLVGARFSLGATNSMVACLDISNQLLGKKGINFGGREGHILLYI